MELKKARIRRHEPIGRVAATTNRSPGERSAPLEAFIEDRTPVAGCLPPPPDSFIHFPEDCTTDHVPNLMDPDDVELLLDHVEPFDNPDRL